jgi:hypothetical protein
MLTVLPQSQYVKGSGVEFLLCCCPDEAYINDTCACSNIPTDVIKVRRTLFCLFNLLVTTSMTLVSSIGPLGRAQGFESPWGRQHWAMACFPVKQGINVMSWIKNLLSAAVVSARFRFRIIYIMSNTVDDKEQAGLTGSGKKSTCPVSANWLSQGYLGVRPIGSQINVLTGRWLHG